MPLLYTTISSAAGRAITIGSRLLRALSLSTTPADPPWGCSRAAALSLIGINRQPLILCLSSYYPERHIIFRDLLPLIMDITSAAATPQPTTRLLRCWGCCCCAQWLVVGGLLLSLPCQWRYLTHYKHNLLHNPRLIT